MIPQLPLGITKSCIRKKDKICIFVIYKELTNDCKIKNYVGVNEKQNRFTR